MRGRFRSEKKLLFHAAVRLLQLVEAVLPRRAARGTFAAIASVAHLIDRPAVRRSKSHLELAMGSELTPAERERVVRSMFRGTGVNLADLFRVARLGPRAARELVQFEDLGPLDRALARGRGVVALSAHLGNWELLGAALAASGYPVHVVAREVFDPRTDQLLTAWRRRWGIRVHPSREGLAPALLALRSGAIVGTLADQDTRGPCVFAEFFGVPARTPVAPFVLARRTGAALVPMWVESGPDGTHRVRVHEDISGPGTSEPGGVVAAWHAVLEEAIRRQPEQWVWHHRRWKTRPSDPIPRLRNYSKQPTQRSSGPVPREAVVAR